MGIFTKIVSNLFPLLSQLNLDAVARIMKGKHNTIILLYHAPEADVFEQHIAYLAKYYNFISLAELINAIQHQNWSQIPRNSMVITFDDGHASNFLLLNTFKKYNIKPTIYICTQIVATQRKFWWQSIPANNGDKSNNYKKISNQARLQRLAEKYNFEQTKDYQQAEAALTMTQIENMKPYVDFQGHTRFHPIMTQLNDAELHEECTLIKEDAHSLGLTDFADFAFPNGNFSQKTIQALQDAGFRSARTTQSGWVNINSNIYKLKTIGITDNASVSKMRLQLTSLLGLWANWKEK